MRRGVSDPDDAQTPFLKPYVKRRRKSLEAKTPPDFVRFDFSRADFQKHTDPQIQSGLTCSVREFLGGFSIKSTADLDAFIEKHRRGGESNHSVLARQWGDKNADVVMRRLEVVSWKTDPLFGDKRSGR